MFTKSSKKETISDAIENRVAYASALEVTKRRQAAPEISIITSEMIEQWAMKKADDSQYDNSLTARVREKKVNLAQSIKFLPDLSLSVLLW